MTEKMVQNGFSKLVLKAAKMYHSQGYQTQTLVHLYKKENAPLSLYSDL